MRVPSATNFWINLFGLVAMLAVADALMRLPIDVDWGTVLLMVAAAAPILVLDVVILRVHRRPSTGLDWSSRRPYSLSRILTRWLGAAVCIGMVAAVYWLAPEYQGSFYDHFYWLVRTVGPWLGGFGLVYLAFIDRFLVDPHCAYWQLGAFLTGRRAAVDGDKVVDLLRSWVIKGFFVPLMHTYAVNNVVDLRTILESSRPAFNYWFDALWSLGFLIDVTFTTMGYLLTMRVFDTHVRSTEPTPGGWAVALICYQPFFSLISRQYLFYNDGWYWGDWLDGVFPIKVAWGIALLATLVIYSGSTVSFGCRFSNLTNRGIITSGTYRFTKHPAYVSKCLSFWMIFVPCVYHGSLYDLIRDTTWLSALSFNYWLRARTEERHLSRDPAYVAYATHMNEHSVFAPLGRLFPFLSYRPPRDAGAPV